eukprot:TRINITY_DN3240_c0_g4_i2.p1 TRINITY_DN3240_c0_g4~~TRINITY_DN3240_c0_g4_i2.p1  ORF type:complete len:204 (-),score=61.22 TRINITY_DN3240_c0_g4_i2:100-711(-)
MTAVVCPPSLSPYPSLHCYARFLVLSLSLSLARSHSLSFFLSLSLLLLESWNDTILIGRHAFIGMGFADRNTAFDFNAAIQDHIKGIKAEKEAAAVASNPGPSKDYSLKQGETIRINIKKGKGKGTGAAPAAAAGGLAAPAMGMVGLKLTPPPPAGQQKRGHQGQVPQQQQQQQQQQQPKEDEWGDFGSASNNAGGGNDWVTF